MGRTWWSGEWWWEAQGSGGARVRGVVVRQQHSIFAQRCDTVDTYAWVLRRQCACRGRGEVGPPRPSVAACEGLLDKLPVVLRGKPFCARSYCFVSERGRPLAIQWACWGRDPRLCVDIVPGAGASGGADGGADDGGSTRTVILSILIMLRSGASDTAEAIRSGVAGSTSFDSRVGLSSRRSRASAPGDKLANARGSGYDS